jgi:hypothetical protein
MNRTFLVLLFAVSPAAAAEYELESAVKIWDAAPHNAFTDLVRHKDRWFCTFREGKTHVSPDGALRILISTDGKTWESAALIDHAAADLRDAKMSVTPDGRLMLNGAAAWHRPKDGASHQSFAWFSKDGKDWGEAVPIGDPGYWLWRVTWHDKEAYGFGYECGKTKDLRFYASADGKGYERVAEQVVTKGYPNESAIVFDPDGTARCLLRRDEGEATALLGKAKAPYTQWSWKDLGVRVGGPAMIRLPSGPPVAVVRLYEKSPRTSVCEIDLERGKLTEKLALPSGGDTSYAGLVWHDGRLWVSYYSSHEGKTSIYLAKVKVK